MNLCRCDQGHFYDKEKYASCPHCEGGSASDDKRTEAFEEDFTVPLTNQDPDDMGSVRTEDQVTVPLKDGGMDDEDDFFDRDIPRTDNTGNDIFGADEDSDHTVGFFDDIFPGSPGAANKSAAKKRVSKVTANKVDTPCVGWLVALGGEHIGTDFRLKVGKNFIGRGPQMDVALTEDKSVSRESHAIVIYEPKAHIYLVQPGESSSLVYRNNEVLLTPMKLEAYDTVTVGDVDLLFMPLCGERFNWEDLLKKMKDNR